MWLGFKSSRKSHLRRRDVRPNKCVQEAWENAECEYAEYDEYVESVLISRETKNAKANYVKYVKRHLTYIPYAPALFAWYFGTRDKFAISNTLIMFFRFAFLHVSKPPEGACLGATHTYVDVCCDILRTL